MRKRDNGNVISNERDFSVSLETQKLFFRLLKRQNDWKENLKQVKQGAVLKTRQPSL